MYVVAVLFETNDPAPFRLAIEHNAAVSRTEPGCRRFDVCYAEAGTRIFLYELYDDEAAFKAHLQTPHFASFAAATRDIIVSRRLESYEIPNQSPSADR